MCGVCGMNGAYHTKNGFSSATLRSMKIHAPFIIRYEDMIERPEHAFSELFEHVGLDTACLPDCLEACRGGRNIPIKGVFRRGSTGEWREYLTEQEIETFRRLCGAELVETGYEENLDWSPVSAGR